MADRQRLQIFLYCMSLFDGKEADACDGVVLAVKQACQPIASATPHAIQRGAQRLTEKGNIMIEFVIRNDRKTLILFVHGFTGGRETWKNAEYGNFYDILASSETVTQACDIAVFEYFTTLTSLFAKANSMLGQLKSLFKNITPKSKKNISIEEISELLRSEIRFQLQAYESIVVIAHSMGGLVTKSCIVKDIEENKINKIKLFISLAVPHLGANLATFGKYISSNEQINDLAPLSELCPSLNDRWVKLPHKPAIKYFYGSHDSVVSKNSAIGTDNVPQDVIACDDDHLTICKPEGGSSTTVAAVKHFLQEYVACGGGDIDLSSVKKLVHESQFDDEYFVLKLILADVHTATVQNSKEHFLNAEYARKLFSSAVDQRKLAELYSKIRTIYQDSYDKYVHDGIRNSGELVSYVHEKIVDADSEYLKTALPLIHALHKKGMLHQLANDLSQDIWWSKNKSVEAIENLKAKLIDKETSCA